MHEQDTRLRQAQDLLDGGQDIETVLRYLRRSGFNIIDSIKATMQLTGSSLGDAKQIVHTSEAWSDLRAEYDAYHRELEASIDRLADDEAIGAARHRKDDRG